MFTHQPELMSGTLRQNLDPFSEHDDATLNDALRAAGLFSLHGPDARNRITLDTSLSSGGTNLSVGQRQILALARAIVRRSKLLILDEGKFARSVRSVLSCLLKRGLVQRHLLSVGNVSMSLEPSLRAFFRL